MWKHGPRRQQSAGIGSGRFENLTIFGLCAGFVVGHSVHAERIDLPECLMVLAMGEEIRFAEI